jgi:hypothetical protein
VTSSTIAVEHRRVVPLRVLSVDDTTYFGIVLNLSPNSPSTCGHTGANPSYVTRPRSSASEAIVSSNLNASPSGPREKSSVQPTRSNVSVPLGASTTPSTEMYSVMTILPMPGLLSAVVCHYDCSGAARSSVDAQGGSG